MVDQGSTFTIPPAALLEALSKAFVYPWNGVAETLDSLRAFDPSPLGEEMVERVAGVLAASDEFADRTAEQLAYTRLFIGSFKMEAPPYASYYLEEARILNGQAAAEVEAVYAQFGVELGADEKVPPDHIRYLLAFSALLAARFEETGEESFAEAYVDFRDAYLLTWIGGFKELVDRYAEDGYYPALVALVVDVLESEGD